MMLDVRKTRRLALKIKALFVTWRQGPLFETLLDGDEILKPSSRNSLTS